MTDGPRLGDGVPEWHVPTWVPAVLRYACVGLLAPPAISKFVTYDESVVFFASLGIPAPELMVVLVGVIEVGAIALLVLDIGRWIVVLALAPVMLVAVRTSGDWQAVAVLLCVGGLLALDHAFLVVTDDHDAP